jgi:phospholipase A1
VANGTSVVVLIAGTLGSQLSWTDTNDGSPLAQLIWPPNLGDELEGYRWNTQLLSDSVEPDGIIMTAGCDLCPIYQPLVDRLESWGFHRADGTLILLAYDWRKSATDVARQLADTIGSIAQNLPSPSIAILAHSFGGLVSRYYLESGDFQPDAHVAQLIMMATPNLGAPDALITRMGGDAIPTVSSDEVRRLADDARYPSTYQLFPPASEIFAFDSSDSNKEINVYDPANGLMPNPSNLNSAIQFQGRLDASKRGQVKYFCFYGQQHATYTSAYLRRDSEGSFQLDTAKTQKMSNQGDGTVPILSARLALPDADLNGDSAATHETIFQDDDLLRALAGLLGKPQEALAIVPRVQVFASRRPLRGDRMVRTVIKFPAKAEMIRGTLRVEKVDPKGQTMRVVSRHSIAREGTAEIHRAIMVPFPKTSGTYRVTFQRLDRSEPETVDSFYVRPSEQTRERRRERAGRKRRSAK